MLTSKALTTTEQETIEDVIVRERHPYYLAYACMLWAGLRVGETVKLTWDQLVTADDPNGWITLNNNQTKTKTTRTIPINANLATAITIAYGIIAYQARPNPRSKALACKRTGKVISTRSLDRHLVDLGYLHLKRHITTHTLRHTFATRLLKVSNIRIAQDLLGHARLSTTQLYTHTNSQELRTAIEQI